MKKVFFSVIKRLSFSINVLLVPLMVTMCTPSASTEGKSGNDIDEPQENYSAQAINPDESDVISLSSYGATVISTTDMKNDKREINIRLEEQISEDDLTVIAKYLKEQNPGFKRLFIFYLLPDMKLGAGAWATTHYNPNLEVNILGLSKSEEKQLKQASNVSGEVIGKWYDSSPYVESTLIIYKYAGKLMFKTIYKDGSENEKTLQESTVGGKRKFVYESSYGEYLLVHTDGNLGIYDRDGHIATAKRIPY